MAKKPASKWKIDFNWGKDFWHKTFGEHIAEDVKNEPGETKAEAFGKEGEIATEKPAGIPEIGGLKASEQAQGIPSGVSTAASEAPELSLSEMAESVVRMGEEARAHSREVRGATEGLQEDYTAEPSPLAGEKAQIGDAPEWATSGETATETAGAASAGTSELSGFAESVAKFGKIAEPIGWGLAGAESIEGASRLDIQDTAKPMLTMGGAVAGASAGGALGGALAGTAVAPGIGTAIGAIAGAIGGAVVGEKVGEQLPHSVAGIQSDPGGMQTITAQSQDQNTFSPQDMMQALRSMDRHMQSMVNDGVRVREGGARTGNKL